jgi:Mannosyltransferase (PIG-V)
MSKAPRWTLVGLWALWIAILFAYQTIAIQRYNPARPDRAVLWSANETAFNSQNDKPYLVEPFLNEQVSWDAEFYLSIAVAGYDDPEIRTVRVTDGRELSLSYAFFPGYPFAIRALSVPLSLLGQTPIATATLAGVIIAALGTLAALFALYELVFEDMGHEGALRTALYLLIFPTSFYLIAVFTEGLFLGLTLWALVLLKRKQWALAGVLAALATFTRATGLLLIVPMGIAWAQHVGWRNLLNLASCRRRELLFVVLAVALPVIAYLIWNAALGDQFHKVEDSWFGRGLGNFQRVAGGWQNGWNEFITPEYPERRIYYLMEFGAFGLTVVMALVALRRYPALAAFSLLALALGAFTSAPQSLVRYVLTAPALFIGLGILGKHTLFDRGWTMLSLLLLAMQMFLFAKDMWTA